MGSIGKALRTGFICRLCTKQKKIVVHLYTTRAKNMDLMKKIKMLPITLKKYDSLPKTICEACIEKLDMQYNLILRIRKNDGMFRLHEAYHGGGNCPEECPLHRVDQVL